MVRVETTMVSQGSVSRRSAGGEGVPLLIIHLQEAHLGQHFANMHILRNATISIWEYSQIDRMRY